MLAIVLANINSPQALINVKMIITASPGLAIGIIILYHTCRKLHPSMVAASDKSVGIFLKVPRMMNMDMGKFVAI